jgi:hypothetical protein
MTSSGREGTSRRCTRLASGEGEPSERQGLMYTSTTSPIQTSDRETEYQGSYEARIQAFSAITATIGPNEHRSQDQTVALSNFISGHM